MYRLYWFCEDKCKGFGIPNFPIIKTQAVLFTNLVSPISVLNCMSLIRYRLKMGYLHLNGSFLVVKTGMDKFAQIGIYTFNLF